MAINNVKPESATAPVTVFYNPKSRDESKDVADLQAKDKDGKLVFVDVTAADFKADKYGVSADVVGKHPFAKDAAGTTYSGSDAFYAAFSAVGFASYFRYVRYPGFHCTVSSSSFGSR